MVGYRFTTDSLDDDAYLTTIHVTFQWMISWHTCSGDLTLVGSGGDFIIGSENPKEGSAEPDNFQIKQNINLIKLRVRLRK